MNMWYMKIAYRAGAIVKNLTPNVNTSHCMDLVDLRNFQKNVVGHFSNDFEVNQVIITKTVIFS